MSGGVGPRREAAPTDHDGSLLAGLLEDMVPRGCAAPEDHRGPMRRQPSRHHHKRRLTVQVVLYCREAHLRVQIVSEVFGRRDPLRVEAVPKPLEREERLSLNEIQTRVARRTLPCDLSPDLRAEVLENYATAALVRRLVQTDEHSDDDDGGVRHPEP